MARIRSVDFLPEIFQTPTNKKFLSSTLDQLIQEPKLKQTQGYIGSKTAPGKLATDGYVDEPTLERERYQLEPGVVFNDENGKPNDVMTYIDLLNSLRTDGASTANHDRLFRNATYSWSPFVALDKLVNYSQYFWLPSGPDSVDVAAGPVSLIDDFDVTANDSSVGISGFSIGNPEITLFRGGSYTFNVQQPGNPFYIQTYPGVSGTAPWAANISSRSVLGVSNNGEDNGTVTFDVPLSDAQDFYHNLTSISNVDLATTERFDSISNQYLADIGGSINGVQSLNAKTIVFVDATPGDSVTLGWQYEEGGATLDTLADRYQVFRIEITYDINDENPFIVLHPLTPVNFLEKFSIQYGSDYSNTSFFKNVSGFFEQIPVLSASLDTLYYQDAVNPDRVGIINIIDQGTVAELDVTKIIGRATYTSPNDVVFSNGLKVVFRGGVSPAEYSEEEFYVEGVGTAIKLVAASNLTVPEPYAEHITSPWDMLPWDSSGLDGTLNAPSVPDYITVNRSSLDRNAWSRSNRWFHIDVILATASYNGVVADLDNNNRAARPIIEFDANLRLLNCGTNGKGTVSIIDFVETDALSAVNGAASYTTDGYQLTDGSRVIFANDTDAEVRNKIYDVELIDIAGTGSYTINLTLAADSDSVEDDVVVVARGLEVQGKTFSFTGGDWVESQTKIAVNQAPLFDVYDADGNSLSERAVYPSTTFTGTKLFSYAPGFGTVDPIIGLQLKYLNIDNLGDIVFENNLYTDTFLYAEAGQYRAEHNISSGFVREYTTQADYTTRTGWVNSATESRLPQILLFKFANAPIELDIVPLSGLPIPSVRVTSNSVFIGPSNYTLNGSTITFGNGVFAAGDDIKIRVLSDSVSPSGYYEVPKNLSSNIFNENVTELTLGTIRNHYNNLTQNILNFSGVINGANNTRDLGDVSKYGNIIVQHSAPLALASTFVRNNEHGFFDSVTFAARQYEKFKNQVIEWVTNNDVYEMTPGEILDSAVKEINAGKSISSAFYWSDMLPSGTDYETTEYEITAISSDTFTTLKLHDFTVAGSSAILVYHNDVLLTKDTDYIVATDGPRITLMISTEVGDVIRINEYNTTVGSMLPSTPTKLGLYPKFKPAIVNDNTYSTPVDVVVGHDGSTTIAFGDIRDDVLLEFETRVYNNIKVTGIIPITTADVIPGQFRVTDYTNDEIVEILSPSLLAWLGWNRIDYKTQDYNKSDEKTWNYSSSVSLLNNTSTANGFWRGVYIYHYDTDAPHTRPWEMVGLVEQPVWWESYYGPAPYTSGNLVLWDDMEAGLIREPGNEHVDERYVRTGLTHILPVDGEGNLLTPLQSVIGSYSAFDFKKSWKIGDMAPAESAWRKSSAWPYAVQKLFALTKPAQYFTLMVDRDRYKYDELAGQYLYDGRHRIDARAIEIGNNDTIKHSYINWIVDYNKQFGFESVGKLQADLAGLDVNLCHHMASFSDKNNLKIFTDKSSPDSTNSSLLLPDESFELLLHKNHPVDEIVYSSIIVQKLDSGYAVSGNSATSPYFKVLAGVQTGRYRELTVGQTIAASTTVKVPNDYGNTVEYIPYGQVFANRQAVATFIAGHSEFLTRQGLRFNDVESAQIVNWDAMIREFLYWADQGWAPQSVINLNPAAGVLEFEREFAIVDSLIDLGLSDTPLNQNKEPLSTGDYTVDRIDNNFKMTMLNNAVVSYLKIKLTSYEHLLVIDNTSIFNDLIYDPVTGLRQHRVKLSGFTTYDWNGQMDAQGFLYNADNVSDWSNSKSYNKGDIVKFKNAYWIAMLKVQPSATFDFNNWTKTNYDRIKKGLLPNLATKSDQALSFYNNKNANLESDSDLMSFGLIGFRKRDYLHSLDLDDISQVNIYSDMIKNKGTMNSLNLFQGVTLNSEVIDYQVFENWGIRRATYGATGSRSYIELQLNESLLAANPSIVGIVDSTIDDPIRDQTILVNNIYKQSEKNTSKNILPLVTDRDYDTSLPSAGFVNRNDVDIAVFAMTEITIESDISHGTIIWVASDTPVDWNVYAATTVNVAMISAIDNLNGTLSIEFATAHDLAVGSTLVIKDFDSLVDGVHQILSSSTATRIEITGELKVNQTIVANVDGYALTLVSLRTTVASDIAGSVFDNKLYETNKIWVDDFSGRSAVFEKSLPFAVNRSEINPTEQATSEFGYSIAQCQDGSGMIVGDPLYSSTGAVSCYNKINSTNYILAQVLTATGQDIGRYGEAVTLSSTWGAIGAPGDAIIPGVAAIVIKDHDYDTFSETQLIVAPVQVVESDFGASAVVCTDENWVFVGEPSLNQVHVYQKVEYQNQQFRIISDGSAVIDVSASILAVDKSELQVSVESVVLAQTDFEFNGTSITLDTAPAVDDIVTVARKMGVTFNGDTITDTFAITELHAINGTESARVVVDGLIQRPYYDYTIDGANDLIFTTPPGTGTGNITVTLITHYRYATTIVKPVEAGDTGAENFGAAIDVTSDSSHIVITAPNATVDGLADAGKAYIYSRVVERFVVTDPLELGYTTRRTLTPTSNVFVNGVALILNSFNVGGEYSITGNAVTLLANDIAQIGDFVDIDTNEFTLIEAATATTVAASATFGNAVSICKSKCSIYLGAENDNSGQGSVTRLVNRPRLNGIIQTSIQDLAVTAGTTIRINNIDVEFTGTSVASAAVDINEATTPNIQASVVDGYLIIELIHKNSGLIIDKLDVLPGIGNTMASLGLQSYYNAQTVTSPITTAQAQHFGSAVHIDLNLNQLVIGAANGDMVDMFDNVTVDTGAVYTYDLLQDTTALSEGKLAFGQQIADQYMHTGARFGAAVNLVNNTLVTGAPDYNSALLNDTGRIAVFDNATGTLSWNVIQLEKDIVNTSLINSMYIYDNATLAVNAYLDYIDPLNGKILGVAKQNIDVLTPYDPAVYGAAQPGLVWSSAEEGRVWWNISSVRFMDYRQPDIAYGSKVWGNVFPGSSVDVYQWTKSKVAPANYTGEGEVYDTSKYILTAELDRSGLIGNTYYFWVKGITTVSFGANKTLSVGAIASYIESPVSSGIPFAALIDRSTISLYNSNQIIHDARSILHVEYDKIRNSSNVFVEYDLLRQNHPGDFLSDSMYKKLQDSLCGADSQGNLVPDLALNDADKYGISFRPRQSLFVDRHAALSSYLLKVNAILQQHPIAESKVYPLLISEEAIPLSASGAWDAQVANNDELSYQDLSLVAPGYLYLVESDENASGLWTIYEVTDDPGLHLVRVQQYDTKKYWTFENWYDADFNPFTKIDYTVNTYSELQSLTVENNAVVKVVDSNDGKWAVYKLVSNSWVRVALEDGTIQFASGLWDTSSGSFGFDTESFAAQNFDEEPVTELRNIIRSINEELLIDNLAAERSTTIISVFAYILSEQPHVDWLHKTSLIDVTQKVRSLSQYAVYQKDNQDYLLDYIKEAKPYHTKIKDFLLSYDGFDTCAGNVTDFDCPSVYSAEYRQFISPILDDGAILVTDPSNVVADAAQWAQEPWKQWFDNNHLTITEVIITNAGTGYTTVPDVEVIGTSLVPTVLRARIGSDGLVKAISIVSAGTGYSVTPVISITGGGGSNATAIVRVENKLVRTFKTTLKYDRYEYQPNVVTWEPATVYDQNQLVRVLNTVYRLPNADGIVESPAEFDSADAELVDIATLSGIDRTSGYYVSDVNNPGLDLSLLINGIVYPGVAVDGLSYALGSDADDNVPAGQPTYDTAILDAAYSSSFLDTYLGTRPGDINVTGGEFIDTYHSHAPEELVPGAIFDTLDLKVWSRPGADYSNNGHGFLVMSVVYDVASAITFTFSDLVEHPVTVAVVNVTTGKTLYEGIDFTVDWPAQQVTVNSGITGGDRIKVFAYEIGGGNQLHRATLSGDEIVDYKFRIPVALGEIYKLIIFANGVKLTGLTTEFVDGQTTEVTIVDTLAADDFVTVTVLGTEAPTTFDESYPVVQTFVYGTDALDVGDSIYSSGKNKHTATVEVGGLRLRGPEAARYTGDAATVIFVLPVTGNYQFDDVIASEVAVYVNDVLVDFALSAVTGINDPRFVTLVTAPPLAAVVDVYVRHASEYWWNSSVLVLDTAPAAGAIVAVTTINDDRQSGILCQAFVGPTQVAQVQQDLYDTTPFDSVPFDQELGVNVSLNEFALHGALITNANRLWVTLNGARLLAGEDYELADNNQLVLLVPIIGATDVVMVTTLTDSVVVNSVNFRLFKDMRNSVGMYKIANSTTTYLTQGVAVDDDIIYVRDASVLGQPNLSIARFGILIVGGERITYRERDLIANTVSGLRRGTAGTGTQAHTTGAIVCDVSAKSIVPWDYDRIWYNQGAGTASNGLPLQKQQTIPARFIIK